MNPGELRERLTLRAPVSTKDAVGQDVTTYPDLTPAIWAKYMPLPTRDREYMSAGQKQFSQSVRFVIRRRTDILSTWRLAWLGVEHNVIGCTPLDREWSELLCERGTP
jgi:SPP1 family predicted phage head-tail adaptor